jgi:hypothetical protein
MYALAQENRHVVWKKRWYAITSRISSQVDLYVTQKDQVFVANVVVIHPTRETVVSNVINQLTTYVVVELSAITKIRTYRRLREGHHFISMAMEVHVALGHDMDHFIRECACIFHDKQFGSHLSLSFCIQFFRQRVSIVL